MSISAVTSPPVLAAPAVLDRSGAQYSSNGATVAPVAFVAAKPSAAPAASSTTQDTGAQTPQSPGQVDQAVRQINEAFSQRGQNLYAAFERDSETGINVVKIVDKRTNETIVQMPPKAVLAFAQSMASEEARGRLLHDQA